MSDTVRQLSAESEAVSKDLQALLDFSTKDSDEVGQDVYEKHAPLNGVEVETIHKVKNYERVYGAGLLHATTATAMKALHADPTRKNVKFEVTSKLGNSEEMTATFVGESSGVIGGKDGAPDKPWVKHGSLRLSHKTSTSGKRSDLGIAMDQASAAAESLLKAK